MTDLKTCRDCGETKPLYEFHIDQQKRGGRKNQCRICTNREHAHRRYGRLNREVYDYKPFGRFTMAPGVITLAKSCSECGHLRQAEDFTIARGTSDRLSPVCKFCQRQRWADCDAAARAVTRRSLLKRIYGLTPEEFDYLLINQSGRCAICNEPMTDDLTIDHDHATGAVRGLLGGFCNRGLGMFRDDPEWLRAAADYLEGAEQSSLWVSHPPTKSSSSSR